MADKKTCFDAYKEASDGAQKAKQKMAMMRRQYINTVDPKSGEVVKTEDVTDKAKQPTEQINDSPTKGMKSYIGVTKKILPLKQKEETIDPTHNWMSVGEILED